MLGWFMVSAVSAQGTRPYAPPARQTICKLVTPNSQNVVFCSLSFQSLAHSFTGAYSTTPLQSYCSALFAENTGGRYHPHDLPLIFKNLRTLQNSTRSGRFHPAGAPFSLHGSRLHDTGHLFPCLQVPSFRVIPSLFSSCRCIDRCIDRCIEGSRQASEWTRGGNPGRGNESMRVKENEMKRIRLNLPNRGILV